MSKWSDISDTPIEDIARMSGVIRADSDLPYSAARESMRQLLLYGESVQPLYPTKPKEYTKGEKLLYYYASLYKWKYEVSRDIKAKHSKGVSSYLSVYWNACGFCIVHQRHLSCGKCPLFKTHICHFRPVDLPAALALRHADNGKFKAAKIYCLQVIKGIENAIKQLKETK